MMLDYFLNDDLFDHNFFHNLFLLLNSLTPMRVSPTIWRKAAYLGIRTIAACSTAHE